MHPHYTLRWAIALIVLAPSAQAQRLAPEAVPSAVTAAFAQAYPAAQGAKWSKDGDAFEVAFRIGRGAARERWEVSYSPSGQPLEASRAISRDALPEAVRQAIAQQFAGYRIREAEIETVGGVTRYEVELRKGGDEAEATFELTGQLIEVERDAPKEKKVREPKDKSPKDAKQKPGKSE